ncbi:calcium/proton exchanger [Ramlibacter sp. USB13]|uniref:Ca(2+)/H(+) antiporter n=2 Tax=Ramlibacter cellulosilyticus TaxID=2764187 RepID=A0A923MX90_9BURK|nr:calcium/proton exchanger [Ramlibacter cellulosilyticus]
MNAVVRPGGLRLVWQEVRHNRLLWLLVFVPVVLVAEHVVHASGQVLFVLSVLAIVPLAALLSHATESVAASTGDAVGGLLNATLGNLTELVIALTALGAGQYMLVKGSIAGAIVTNSLFMLGASLVLGGLRHHTQEFNAATARLQAAMLFIATVALLVPSLVPDEGERAQVFIQELSLVLALLLAATYALGLYFSLKTHKEFFGSARAQEADEGEHEATWPPAVAVAVLAGVTVLVALVSEIFVGSVEVAADALGMSDAFVGFVVVALVGAAAEIASAFSAARKNRLDLSVGIALGSSAQIALFVAPVLVLASYFLGPEPMTLQFWPSAVAMMFLATLTVTLVCSGGRSAWFLGVLLLAVYLTFATALYLLPPRA